MTQVHAETRTAGLVTRALAAMIDLAFVGVMMAGFYLGIAGVLFLIRVSDYHWPTASWLFTVPIYLGLDVAYQAICWTGFGRTVGQHLMGLRVVRRTSLKRLHALQALGRSAFCVFFPIGLFWVAFSPTRRSVQDIAVRSRVIYR
ncbi:MAG: RDD family protein [Gordonia sp. (in: high G+C Gram-positive bacteria)]|uniref:RDD family protein n=1 Tax=Gordonia sp. (in: high G+C Gram-positive bacteria) TaxID=84139 RepID=UPI003BB68828